MTKRGVRVPVGTVTVVALLALTVTAPSSAIPAAAAWSVPPGTGLAR